MAPLDGTSRTAPARRLPRDRRDGLIEQLATRLLVPVLLERFAPALVSDWRHEAAALAATLTERPLGEAVAALAEVNPGGQMFRPICRDIILPAAAALRRRHDPEAFAQGEHLSKIWQLRMCLLSLDDAQAPATLPGLPSALTLSGAQDMPSVEHGVALRFFDRAGWEVSDCCCGHAEEACDSAHDRTFDVAWISLEPGQGAEEIRATARDLRRASRNAAILVLGGGVAGTRSDTPGALDLDGFTGSAIEAAVIAESALRLRRAGLGT
jgi:methylmalonyl-CoA mutase cobalamin-binding subunit